MPAAPALSTREALDAALRQIESMAPEFGPHGLSNHAPMVVEALSELGRTDAIAPWLTQYLPQLTPMPADSAQAADGSERLSEPSANAWGDAARFAEWRRWFDQELSGNQPNVILDRWVARLAPGISSALGHGLLRTAHAARAVARQSTQPRIAELAQGLAYWASRYQQLPTVASTVTQTQAVKRALSALSLVPRLTATDRSASLPKIIVETARQADFATVPELLSLDTDIPAFLTDLVTTLARLYSDNIDREDAANPVIDLTFVHAITTASAVRLFLPYVSTETARSLLQPLWVFSAAIYSAFSQVSAGESESTHPPEPEPGVGEVGGRFGELIDEAIVGENEHGIKFTEVCVREVRAGAPRDLLVLSRLVVARLVVAELKRARAEKQARK